MTTAYDFDCADLQGKPLPLRQYAGQPMLIVNTASLCGFSKQFKGLEAVWQNNRDKGLVVLAMPSNDFGQQEPGDSQSIVSLCSLKFGVSFPLLQKSPVSGSDAHPLFKWLAQEGGFFARPRWNFYKYIIGRDGKLQTWFSSFAAPETARFAQAVGKAVK